MCAYTHKLKDRAKEESRAAGPQEHARTYCALVLYSSLALALSLTLRICRLMEAATASALVPPARRQVLILALFLLMAASMARRASSGESDPPGKD